MEVSIMNPPFLGIPHDYGQPQMLTHLRQKLFAGLGHYISNPRNHDARHVSIHIPEANGLLQLSQGCAHGMEAKFTRTQDG